MIAREGYTIIAVVAGLALMLTMGALWVDGWLWRGGVRPRLVGGLGVFPFFFPGTGGTPPGGPPRSEAPSRPDLNSSPNAGGLPSTFQSIS